MENNNKILEQMKKTSLSIKIKHGQLEKLHVTGNVNCISFTIATVMALLMKNAVETPEEQLELLKITTDRAANIIIKKSEKS